ncbi:lipase family protein [Corynebacterium variabile]|uniref:lipase family protein n=1 Tax=Corynebacterium variabile TaxID=1727 RepID=UPI0028B079B0|nr:lipase family protein [Corynebacterium variabile]
MIAGVAGYAVNGALTRYPELGPLMDRYPNDEGKRYLAATADECIGQSVENWEKTDTRTLTVDGRSLAEILQQDPQVNAVFTGPNYRLDDRALNAPMLLINALHDDTIPYGQARELADAYRGLGGTVDFVTDPLPEMMPQTAMNHAIPMFSQAGTAFEWLVDRFNGVPAGA